MLGEMYAREVHALIVRANICNQNATRTKKKKKSARNTTTRSTKKEEKAGAIHQFSSRAWL